MLNSTLLPRLRCAIRFAVLLAVAACGGGGGGGGGGNGGGSASAPLAASRDGRHLVDGSSTRPVLILGDAPQALVVNLTVADADAYFATRSAQGFNAAWVNLLTRDNLGGRSDGSTLDGIAPFTATLPGGLPDLRFPNEAYFARADAMIASAAHHGFHVWLDPIETSGHLATLRANGTAVARGYGQFLGARYKNTPNIVWMSGNDFQTWMDASDDAVVLAVASGIRDQDTRHLQTTELDFPVSSSLDDARWTSLLGFNQVYTYFPTYAELYVDWQRSPHLPNVFIEGNYEGEQLENAPHVTGAVDIRNELWWTVLSGGAGAFYGNHWVFPFLSGWQSHLHDVGAEQVRFVRQLMESKRWSELVPDIDHDVATAGYGTFRDDINAQDNDFVTTASTPDGRLVMSYFPERRSLTIAMSQLPGSATATWFDPTTGNSLVDSASPVLNSGSHVFTPPATPHSDGAADWVLLLETNG